MEIEYEAKFLDIDKDEVRGRLKAAGAKMEKPEILMKRQIFDRAEWPGGKFVRVRDEWGETVVSLKEFSGEGNDHPKETEITTNDYEKTIELFTALGFTAKTYQESLREVWSFKHAEIAVDTWPFLEPFVEIEAASEAEIERVAKALGFDWSKAVYGNVNTLFQKKYGSNIHMRNIPKVAFDAENPFV